VDPRIVRRLSVRVNGLQKKMPFKLKDAVQIDDGKNWNATAGLVPGRTKTQCRNRWRNVLDPRIVRTTERAVRWITEEDDKLRDAIQIRNGKNWNAIARLVPGRTSRQCIGRWQKH
jgi:hypothetical protein